ncbi:MAG: TlpA family protein disulfide reductase [Sulfuricella sp.]|nr:TlpA family protein disulfide reductase [Sulfuricella sp.]
MKRLCLAFLTFVVLAAPAWALDLKPYKGGPTPPLALKDLSGTSHDLRNYAGKVVMVQFWATYCAPCIKEMPSVERLKIKLAGKPFAILAVNMGEDEKEVRAFLKKLKVDFTILMDTDAQAIGDWKVFVAPSTFIVDVQGKIRYTLQGGAEWDTPELMQAIEAMTAENPGN